MFLYMKPSSGGDVFKPVKIENNTYFTNKYHNKYLRITSVLSLTLTPDLKPDFYCKLRVFQGAQLQILAENCIVKGLEGVFIEENQNCEIIRLENGDFEVIRERAVNTEGFKRIGSVNFNTDTRYLPGFNEAKYRFMNGGAILFESQNISNGIITPQFSEINPDGDLLALYYSSNIVTDLRNGISLSEAFFENWDFSNPPNTASSDLRALQYVQGVETIPSNIFFEWRNSEIAVFAEVLKKAKMETIDIATGTGLSGVNFLMENNNSTTNVLLVNADNVGKTNFAFSNNSVLQKLHVSTNKSHNGFLTCDIANCPQLSDIKLSNYYARFGVNYAPDKNYDQLLIDLDNNGIQNGRLELSEDFVRTPLSDTAYNNLINKGWDLTAIRVRA